MTFAFDLISDLHVETWQEFDWTDQATSPYCVVAGDVCRDRNILIETLTHLGQCYGAVFYIDGNDEHRDYMNDLTSSYQDLMEQIQKIPNVVYLQDNVVIINGVCLLATNGWWTYDFDETIDAEQCALWYQHASNISATTTQEIYKTALHDARYLASSVRKLQTHNEVKSIVLISHTVPASWIVEHDPDLVNTWRYNCLGNRHLQLALEQDTEYKIKAWCFGHYHRNVDRDFGGVRYVNNSRGRGNTPWSQIAYYAKRIEIDI